MSLHPRVVDFALSPQGTRWPPRPRARVGLGRNASIAPFDHPFSDERRQAIRELFGGRRIPQRRVAAHLGEAADGVADPVDEGRLGIARRRRGEAFAGPLHLATTILSQAYYSIAIISLAVMLLDYSNKGGASTTSFILNCS